MKKRTVVVTRWTKTEINEDISIVSGTVVSDTSGGFKEGWHCRSTPIIKEWTDESNNRVLETKNSYYSVRGEGNSDPVANLLGAAILGVYY